MTPDQLRREEEALAALMIHYADRPEIQRRLRWVHETWAKVSCGMDDPRPEVAAAYRALSPLSIDEAAPIAAMLPAAAKARGRPKGSGMTAADGPLIEVVKARVAAGEPLTPVCLDLASMAAGGGNPG